ncbi:hypothetical protein PIB30_040150 [Stylosanthes scabra]|uniref:Glycosyltransferase n=1 Tax=Stylosanthes scabra TaxID=79078 RepID=A0ABU6VCG1_9FABA|nr:hypothetical protein [Stylosanthes scabra]
MIMEKKNPCIVMVPSPGLSHLIPLVEFAKNLTSFFLHHHKIDNLHVKLLIPTLGPPSSSMNSILNTKSLPPNITFTLLPQVNPQDLNITDAKPQPATLMQLAVKQSLPFIHQQLTNLTSTNHYHLVSIVFSLFSTDVIHLAKEFNLLSYVFFASGASFLSFCLHLPHLDEQQQQQHDDDDESFLFHHQFTETNGNNGVHIPGCPVPFQVQDFPAPVLYQRSSQAYKSFLGVCREYSLVDGVIVNTFTDLESDAIKAIEDQAKTRNNNANSPFVYPIGPLIQTATTNQVNRLECLTWLDNQPPKSVLYISFGSGGTVSQEQLNEIAFGLELSGNKFLWVLRAPNSFGGSAYLKEQKEDPLHYLPSGFLDRTKGQGLVVTSWAPQVEILAHGSTGGFLTHCGWNSILESVVYGVPMIAWPLFAEQSMNAVLLKDVLKVALMPEKAEDEDGIIKREGIANVIMRIMEENKEGLEIRKRIKEFSDAAAAAAISENGGSSAEAFLSVAEKFKSRI